MKKLSLLMAIGLLLVHLSYSQILYNRAQCYGAPKPRHAVPQAELELVADNGFEGLLLPRVKDTNAITAGGVTGLMVYATTDNRLYMYNGTRWTPACHCNNVELSGPTTPSSGADMVNIQSTAGAVMDLSSPNKGLLLPRVRDTNAISAGPVAGLLIYSASDNQYYLNNGKMWLLLGNCGTAVPAGPTTKTGSTAPLPDPSAVADIRATDRGLLLPRVLDTNAIKTGVTGGLMIYATSDNMVYLHNGKYWMQICATVPGAPAIAGFTNCPGQVAGTLTQGVSASGVTITPTYSGGNGESYPAMSIASTGVGGLTATLAAGKLASGNGSLVFTITGTPSGSGTAIFPLSFGGMTCTMTMPVQGGSGSITAFTNCPVTVSGSFTQGTAASATATLNYTGGNGGSYQAMSIASTGVGGLTATLAAGTLASGNGSLVFTISGTPSGTGTALFPVSFAGQSCTLQMTVNAAPRITSLNCPGTFSSPGGFTGGVFGTGTLTFQYTGGNGVPYGAQIISSQGVTGLTATLNAGTLSNGAGGTLTFMISGTPVGGGTATFAVSLFGAPACNVQVPVKSPPATVTSFTNCPGMAYGKFTQGVYGTTTVLLMYAGSNEGTFSFTAIPSQGVTGLTATFLGAVPGTNGTGTLRFQVSGVATGSGIAYFPVYVPGATCRMQVTVYPPAGPLVASFACPGTAAGSFVQGTPGTGTITLNYTGGNGLAYPTQTIPSQGVGGLTATLIGSTLSNGNGTLTFQISGTPTGSGAALFPVNLFGAPSCNMQMQVAVPPPPPPPPAMGPTVYGLQLTGQWNQFTYAGDVPPLIVNVGVPVTATYGVRTGDVSVANTTFIWYIYSVPYTAPVEVKRCKGCNVYYPSSADAGHMIGFGMIPVSAAGVTGNQAGPTGAQVYVHIP